MFQDTLILFFFWNKHRDHHQKEAEQQEFIRTCQSAALPLGLERRWRK